MLRTEDSPILVCSYFLLKYEDLVYETENILQILYSFAGIPFSLEAKFHMMRLTHGKKRKGFYGLTRNSTFDPNHWKHDNIDKIKLTTESFKRNFRK